LIETENMKRAVFLARLALTAGLVFFVTGVTAAQSGEGLSTDERLRRIEQRLEQEIETRDARIRDLELEIERIKAGSAGAVDAPPPATTPRSPGPGSPAIVEQPPEPAPSPPTGPVTPADAGRALAAETAAAGTAGNWAQFAPGVGFTVANTDLGTLELSLYSYIRYLNATATDDTYVDRFGQTQEVLQRNEVQVNKTFLYTKGWAFDPRLRYFFYVWASAPLLGTGLNTLVAGNMSYTFNEHVTAGAGVFGLPSTRSLTGQFPQWLRTDARLIADEFMRGSYTQGLFANGKITDKINYMAGLGNNLNAFGVPSSRLDDRLDTLAVALRWMPTTGEFGPRANVGDFEEHERLATLFSVHYTQSTEDKESQPNRETPENTAIRLSDGTSVFDPNVFGPGVQVEKLDYRMLALNAGMKLRGFSLEGEVYFRQLDDFRSNAPVPIGDVEDQGVQLMASTMLLPKSLQLYVNGSKIYGDERDSWDAGIGLNWWPFRFRGLRVNSEVMYVENSPVGSSTLPYLVGSDGTIFMTNLELAF
jgi:hypothetical protein